MIIRKSRREIEGMARAGELVAETIALLGEHAQPGITTAELDRIAEEFIREHGGVPTVEGLPRLSGGDVHLAERDGRARDPRRATGRGGRRDLGRRRRHARRLRRRQRRTRSRSARSTPSRSGCSTSARRRSRPGIEQARAGNRGRRHLPRGPAVVEGAGLLGRPLPRRPRRRPLLPRGPADPELRRARPRPAAAERDDARDRADDHRRRPRGRTSTTTSGRSRPRTARWRPISSTRSR